ncbi:MAG: hypothetical protein AAF702_44840 [Chloroflexota bacterium]
MWTTNPPLNLIRYLFAIRVNSSLVRLPRFPSLEFSLVLGSMMTERLSSRQARPWRKALQPWQGYEGEILSLPTNLLSSPQQNQPQQNQRSNQRKNQQNQGNHSSPVPEIVWPLDLVIHVYPGKLLYGKGEPILWEMKLFGRDADHRLFLEQLLPAVEEAGITRDQRWKQPAKLWGNFDIESISVAHGLHWEPLVEAGQINFQAFPTPMQWAEELPFTQNAEKPLSKLTWLTPFVFEQVSSDSAGSNRSDQKKSGRQGNQQNNRSRQRRFNPPTIDTILAATAQQLSRSIPIWQAKPGSGPLGGGSGNTIPDDKKGDAKRVEEALETWQAVRQRAKKIRVLRNELQKPPRYWPGQGVGEQQFDLIPPELEPYLMLASILHVGQYRHFGCGTFMLTV